jgi:hypothetical protein
VVGCLAKGRGSREKKEDQEMPFLDWVNKNQAKETTREVPYHLLKQVSVHGDVSGAHADNLLIQGDNRPLVNRWHLYDNTGEKPVLMASGENT